MQDLVKYSYIFENVLIFGIGTDQDIYHCCVNDGIVMRLVSCSLPKDSTTAFKFLLYLAEFLTRII